MKRRLAADIGPVEAHRFYRRTLTGVVRRVAGDPRWSTVLVVTPNRWTRYGRWWPPGVQRIAQGRGDLGRRMARALMRFPRSPILLIGSDIPAIDRPNIAAAFRLLGRNDFTFGPAVDGGYWLVGAKPGRAARRMFDGVRWSTEHALADTLRAVGKRRIGFATTLEDVDDGAAWERWRATPVTSWPGQVRP